MVWPGGGGGGGLSAGGLSMQTWGDPLDQSMWDPCRGSQDTSRCWRCLGTDFSVEGLRKLLWEASGSGRARPEVLTPILLTNHSPTPCCKPEPAGEPFPFAMLNEGLIFKEKSLKELQRISQSLSGGHIWSPVAIHRPLAQLACGFNNPSDSRRGASPPIPRYPPSVGRELLAAWISTKQ